MSYEAKDHSVSELNPESRLVQVDDAVRNLAVVAKDIADRLCGSQPEEGTKASGGTTLPPSGLFSAIREMSESVGRSTDKAEYHLRRILNAL